MQERLSWQELTPVLSKYQLHDFAWMKAGVPVDWPKIGGTYVIPATGPEGAAGISFAARLLREGKLVAFPTETVYGLGADALNAAAVARVFAVKGRPADNPLIVHVAGAAQMEKLAKNIPKEAWLLAGRFWPGPLTLVLESSNTVPKQATGGQDSVALRVPAHPVALSLLCKARVPVAAPSANLSGRPSPTTAAHVLDDLAGHIDAVLDGGSCQVGVESTVLDIRGGRPLLLRPGGVTPEEIASTLGIPCGLASWHEGAGEGPPSPGMKYTHYAPKAPLYLVCGEPEAVVQRIGAMAGHFRGLGYAVGLLLSRESAGRLSAGQVEVLGSRNDPASLAANLYGALRRFDRLNVDVILAEGYSEEGLGLALMNRLRKAAGDRIIQAE